MLHIYADGRRGAIYNFSSHVKELANWPTFTSLTLFLADALPDTWGHRLIERSLQRRNVEPHGFLLGVSDIQRSGSLTFKEKGVVLAPGMGVPPVVDIGAIDAEIRAVVGARLIIPQGDASAHVGYHPNQIPRPPAQTRIARSRCAAVLGQ